MRIIGNIAIVLTVMFAPALLGVGFLGTLLFWGIALATARESNWPYAAHRSSCNDD